MIVALPGASVTASIGPLWQGGGFLLPQKGLCRNLYLLIGLPSCQAGRMFSGTPEQRGDAENLRLWEYARCFNGNKSTYWISFKRPGRATNQTG